MVWRYGPQGELSRGDFDHQRAWKHIGFLALGLIIGCYFFPLVLFPAFIVFVCGIGFLYKLSRYRGTEAYLDKFQGYAHEQFAIPSLALLAYPYYLPKVASWIGEPDTGGLSALLIGAYIWYVHWRLTHDKLWNAADTEVIGRQANGAAALEELAVMAQRLRENAAILREQGGSDTLKTTQDKLAAAHEAKNHLEISRILDSLNEQSRTLMVATVSCLNRGIQFRERANLNLQAQALRSAMRMRLLSSEQQAKVALNADKVALVTSKYLHAEMGRILPPKLTETGIGKYHANAGAAVGRTVAQGLLGKLPPILAILGVATTLILDQVYKSRLLRQLKDAEGEVFQTWHSAVGDRNTIIALVETRYVPDLELIANLCGQLSSQKPSEFGADEAKLTSYAIALKQAEFLLEKAKE